MVRAIADAGAVPLDASSLPYMQPPTAEASMMGQGAARVDGLFIEKQDGGDGDEWMDIWLQEATLNPNSGDGEGPNDETPDNPPNDQPNWRDSQLMGWIFNEVIVTAPRGGGPAQTGTVGSFIERSAYGGENHLQTLIGGGTFGLGQVLDLLDLALISIGDNPPADQAQDQVANSDQSDRFEITDVDNDGLSDAGFYTRTSDNAQYYRTTSKSDTGEVTVRMHRVTELSLSTSSQMQYGAELNGDADGLGGKLTASLHTSRGMSSISYDPVGIPVSPVNPAP